MSRKTGIALVILVMFLVAICGAACFAAVKTAPKHPGHYNVVANTPQQHMEAAEHHKKMAAYHRGMARHHESMAMEHKRLGHTKLHRHHMMMAKHHKALAMEHEATARTHMEHATKPTR
jgi:hypothetical protein